jgi:hypothetical protein
MPSAAECRQLCNDIDDCNIITHFGAGGFPFADTCILFSSCPTMNDCTDCLSEDTTCYQSLEQCSSQVEGQLGPNLVEFIPDVVDEKSCWTSCTANETCSFYTFHGPTDEHLPNACFLLSELKTPLQQCNNCRCCCNS